MTSGKDEISAPAQYGSTGRSCLLLLAVMVALLPVFAWVGHDRRGMAGVWAAIFACGVCWLSATVALWLVGMSRHREWVIHATLIGTLFRTGLPLSMGLLLQHQGGELAQGGVFGMILLYYFVALALETALSVRLISGSKGTAAKA